MSNLLLEVHLKNTFFGLVAMFNSLELKSDWPSTPENNCKEDPLNAQLKKNLKHTINAYLS